MNAREAMAARTAAKRIEILPSTTPPWVDENGREWATVNDQPITMAPAPNDMRHTLLTFEEIERFTLAGNATLTLVSKKTGKRYTFKVNKPNDWRAERPIWFVSVLKGADNTSDFGYIGEIRRNSVAAGTTVYNQGRKCWRDWYAASEAFEWFWDRVRNRRQLSDQVEVWHEGKCGRCGRKLTVPESVASGFGPECINHV